MAAVPATPATAAPAMLAKRASFYRRLSVRLCGCVVRAKTELFRNRRSLVEICFPVSPKSDLIMVTSDFDL